MASTTADGGLRRFFILSYALFWLMLAATGAALALKPPAWVAAALKNLCAWSPTFALLLLFKRLFPGRRLGEWLKASFSGRIGVGLLLGSLGLQALALAAAAGIAKLVSGAPLSSLRLAPLSVLLPAFLVDLTSGPLGEELGWRGYAYGAIRKRHSATRASLLLGLAWGFWHLPLWLLSGFSGRELAVYVLAFLVAIVSVSVVIGRLYERSRNVLVAMWAHLWFNYLAKFPAVELLPLMVGLACVYAAIAAAIVVAEKEKGRRGAPQEPSAGPRG